MTWKIKRCDFRFYTHPKWSSMFLDFLDVLSCFVLWLQDKWCVIKAALCVSVMMYKTASYLSLKPVKHMNTNKNTYLWHSCPAHPFTERLMRNESWITKRFSDVTALLSFLISPYAIGSPAVAAGWLMKYLFIYLFEVIFTSSCLWRETDVLGS